MRLLSNKLLIFNNISTIFYILGSSGFITFMGRVMEVQFNKTSAGGSIFTGPITILGMAIGLLACGYFITKYKPPPKYLFFWNVVIGLISMCAALSYTQLGCGSNSNLLVNGSIVTCNSNCNCDGVTYSPVCDRLTYTTYYSPCHAGCKTFDEKKNIYTDCTCNEAFISAKRSTSAKDYFVESLTNRSIVENRLDGKQTTLYEIYDDELKPDKQPHDDDEIIDGNDLYEDSYEDSEETSENTEEKSQNTESVDLVKDDSNARARRDMQIEKVVTPGACVGDCTYAYYTFSLISMVSSLISSTGRIGNVLLNFR